MLVYNEIYQKNRVFNYRSTIFQANALSLSYLLKMAEWLPVQDNAFALLITDDITIDDIQQSLGISVLIMPHNIEIL